MDRRQLLKSAGTVALAAMAGSALAETHEHAHHGSGRYDKVMATAGACIVKGEVCLAHCISLMADGDKTMAACAKSVNQMLSVCTALQSLAAQASSHVAEIARLAAVSCKECEAECKKHADKHDACKDCMDACSACRKECEALSV